MSTTTRPLGHDIPAGQFGTPDPTLVDRLALDPRVTVADNGSFNNPTEVQQS